MLYHLTSDKEKILKASLSRFVLLSALLSLSMFSATASAIEPACQIADAKVTSIFTWEDGTTFITLDKSSNCGCMFANRFGIPSSHPHAKTYIAQAMLALAVNNKVDVYGVGGCTVHGNAAALYSIVVTNKN